MIGKNVKNLPICQLNRMAQSDVDCQFQGGVNMDQTTMLRKLAKNTPAAQLSMWSLQQTAQLVLAVYCVKAWKMFIK